MKNNIQTGLWMLLITGVAVIAYNITIREMTPPTQSYTQFIAELREDKILKIHLKGGAIEGEDVLGRRFSTYSPDVSSLMPLLSEHNIEISAEAPASGTLGGSLQSLIPLFLILGAWFIFTRNKSW